MQNKNMVLFKNATIITMENENETTDALLTSNDKIIAVGSESELMDRLGNQEVKVINLHGKTIMPGFLDAHGHFFLKALSQKAFVDVSCFPIGKIKSLSMLIEEMTRYCNQNKGSSTVIGFGFDDTLIEEYRMPTAKDLDQISTTRGIIILHTSIHMMSANTKAIERSGLLYEKSQPKGGTVYYENGIAKGWFEEMAAMLPVLKKALSLNMLKGLFRSMRTEGDRYLQKGLTTVCEGAGNMSVFYQLSYLFCGLQNRAILCPSHQGAKLPPRIKSNSCSKLIDGPVKLILDGSIQANTAYLSKPYYKSHPTRSKAEDYAGFPSMNVDQLLHQIQDILRDNRSFAIHCNGDGAIDLLMEACAQIEPKLLTNKRNLIIHCQTIREDQLDQLKKYHLYPSFFSAHIYVWGDRHYHTFLGPKRGARINPAASAVRRGIPFSLHNDAPVTNADPLQLVWNAVTRKTSTGMILGEDQKISIYEALKGITINVAYQYGLECSLGSIKKGKKADFVILNKNPLTCDADEIKNIKVEATFIDGKQVFRRKK